MLKEIVNEYQSFDFKKEFNEGGKVPGFIGTFDIETFAEDGSIKVAEKELDKLIKKLTGANTHISLEVGGSGLTGNTPPIQHKPKIFKNLYIYLPGSGYDEEGGYLWLSLNYGYDLYDGGSNGTKIADVWILPNGHIASYKSKF